MVFVERLIFADGGGSKDSDGCQPRTIMMEKVN
jgi:hypothetical protein